MQQTIVSGIITGMLYGLVGLSLVVVYRASKVMNFALGGMGVAVAYLASGMLSSGVPYLVVLPLTIVVGALLGAVIDVVVVGPMRGQGHLSISLGTLGVLLALVGVTGWQYGYTPSSVPPVLRGAGQLSAGGVTISANRMFIVATAVTATCLLLWIFARTRLGLAMRAVSSGPITAELMGVRVPLVRTASWALGGAYGCLAALLVVPQTYLSPMSFTSFTLTAFAAVVIGGMTNVLGVVVGAVLFGATINVLTVYLQSGLIATYTFIGVAVVLLFRPHGLFGQAEKEIVEPDLRRAGRVRRHAGDQSPGEARDTTAGDVSAWMSRRARMQDIAWLALGIAVFVVGNVVGISDLYLLATILATYVSVLGLNVVAGFSGQVSLAASAMGAIGAYTTAYAVNNGVSLVLALLLAAAAGALAGLVTGLPSTRLSGIYLVMFTLMLAFSVQELILVFDDVTGGARGVPLVAPDFATPERQFGIVLAVAALCTACVLVTSRSSWGRAWRAVRDSPPGARSVGFSPVRVKLGAFVYGNALMAVGGGLSGLLIGYIGPESFTIFISIYALLAVVLGGAGSVLGSLIGASFIVLVPSYSSSFGDVPAPLLFGAALVVVMIFAPEGVAPTLSRLLGAAGRRRSAVRRAAGTGADLAARATTTRATATLADASGTDGTAVPGRAAEVTVAGTAAPEGSAPLLVLDGLCAGYEAGTVLRSVSLEVREGEIVTLLGANGAGKSTVLRCISGLVPPSGGSMHWRGQPIGAGQLRTTHGLARAGIGHVPEGRGIFPDLTVEENLRMGRFAGSESDADVREQVLALFPVLGERRAQRAGTLSGGQQQMLAIGRALVGRPRLLLLDEPSLGLAPVVSQQVFERLGDISRMGVSVLLVEQNARAALDLADRAYVLSRGAITLSGTAAELRADVGLHDAYLEVR